MEILMSEWFDTRTNPRKLIVAIDGIELDTPLEWTSGRADLRLENGRWVLDTYEPLPRDDEPRC